MDAPPRVPAVVEGALDQSRPASVERAESPFAGFSFRDNSSFGQRLEQTAQGEYEVRLLPAAHRPGGPGFRRPLGVSANAYQRLASKLACRDRLYERFWCRSVQDDSALP